MVEKVKRGVDAWMEIKVDGLLWDGEGDGLGVGCFGVGDLAEM